MAEVTFKAYSTNDEQRLVFGLAMLSVTADGQTYTDLQDDQIEPAEIEKAFYDMVEEGATRGDVEHNRKDATSLVECFVVTPQKLDLLLKACGYAGPALDFKGTAAWVGYRVNSDAVWQQVKSGKLRGFSIEAECQRVPA